MKKLLILFIVLVMYLPGYAVVLVYKLTTTFNPMFTFFDANQVNADFTKTKLQTFIVFDINTLDFSVTIPPDTNFVQNVNVIVDINGVPTVQVMSVLTFVRSPERPSAILTGNTNGNRFQMFFGGSEANSVVTIGSQPDSNAIRPVTISGTTTTTSGEIFFINIVSTGDVNQMPLVLTATLFGRVFPANVGIGAAQTILVPRTLKGFADIFSLSQNIVGFGPATATLVSSFTRQSNQNNFGVAQTSANIQASLSKKNFVVVQQFP